MLQASQIRAARALLGWKQDELARAAEVGLATLGRIEQGTGVVQGNFSTIMRLQSTLELQGIRFIHDEDGFGVRLDPAKARQFAPDPKQYRHAQPTRRRQKRSP